jgi:diguanylate cyclase (GGDEF)-like protein
MQIAAVYMNSVSREYIDDLTGLFNRRYFVEQIKIKLHECETTKAALSVILIDLDHFKNVNDTYGHRRGDLLLKEFAIFLKNALRDYDIVFRYGGDEFICLLPQSDYRQSRRIGQRLIEQCRIKEFAQVRLTMSMGIASYPDNTTAWQMLFDIADKNLYSAKRHGRDQIGEFKKHTTGLTIPTKEIVGRTEELKRFRTYLHKIVQGNGGALFISGEVGVGKTRLVVEGLKDPQFNDIELLATNLSVTTKSIPYYPFRDLCRTLIIKEGVDFMSSIAPAYQLEISKIVPELSTESEHITTDMLILDKFRLYEGVRQFFEIKARERPRLVFIDNIHWADISSLELLHYIIRALRNSPILFVFVYRVEEAKDKAFQNILNLMAREKLYDMMELEPLKIDEVARMLALMLDTSPQVELTTYIANETGGNPFFIEELMKSLNSSGAIAWKDGTLIFDAKTRVNIPYSIEGVIERKLSLLDSEALTVLDYAAVVGRQCDFQMLRSVTRIDEGKLFDLLDKITTARILRETERERFYFSDDMMREIIYSKISGVKLKHYHQEIGEQLLQVHEGNIDNTVEELSHHFYLSGDRERTIEYSLCAAEKAFDSYAYNNAILFYNRILECLPGSKGGNTDLREIEYLRKRAQVLNIVGENERAIKDLNYALDKSDKLGNLKQKAACLAVCIDTYCDMSRYPEAIDCGNQAIEIYQQLGDKSGEAETFNSIGIIHDHQSAFDKAYEYYTHALDISKEINQKKSVSRSLNSIGILFDKRGEYEKALEYYTQSLQIAEELHDRRRMARTLNNIGLIYNNTGDFEKALEYYQHSLGLAEEIGDQRCVTAVSNNIGMIHNNRGDYENAQEYYHKALDIVTDIADYYGQSMILSNFGRLHTDLGEYEQALEYHQHSLTIAREIGMQFTEALDLNSIGGLHGQLGNVDKAIEYCTQSLKIREKIGDQKGIHGCLHDIGKAYETKGQLKKALEYYQDAFKVAHEIGDKLSETQVLNAICDIQVEMRDYAAAEKGYNSNLAVAQEMKSDSLLADTYIGLLNLMLATNQHSEARTYLAEVQALTKKMRSKFYDAQVYCHAGRIYTKERDWENAESSFESAHSLYTPMKSMYNLALVRFYQGQMYRDMGDTNRTFDCFAEAEKLFRTIGNDLWCTRIKDHIT